MNDSTALLKALLGRGDYLETLTRAQLLAILPILESAHDEVLGKIAKTGGKWTQEWLGEMASDFDEIYKAASAKAFEKVSPDLEKLGTEEGAWIASEAGQTAVGVSFTTPAPSLFAALLALPTSIGGSTLEQMFEALGVNSREAAYDAIRAGMLSGDTVDQMTRRLRGEVVKRAVWRTGPDGKRRYYPGVYEGGAIEDVSTRQAEMLARTAVMHVANQARDIFYKQNEDLFKGYQYVATLDSNTCIVCASDDGRVFDLDEAKPSLPRHPNDRCLYVPVIKSWEELGIDLAEFPEGTRASIDGQVAESEAYAARLAKMSKEEQNAAIGIGRADLFRGGMSILEMVRNGQAIPLKELRGGR